MIVGIFTVVGVGLTIKHEKKKEANERYRDKPELIVDKCKVENEEDIDMKLIVAKFKVDENENFKYSEEYKNKSEYIFKDFIFKNIGKTAIESLYIASTYKKDTSLLEFEYGEYLMEKGIINYGCMWDKKIFPEGELKVRLYFHKDIVISSGLSCAFIIQFNDSNGKYWEQPFFENKYNLYSPRELSHKEYKDNISTEETIKYFERQYL